MSNKRNSGLPKYVMPVLVGLSIVAVLLLVGSAIRDMQVKYVSAAELPELGNTYTRVAGVAAIGGVQGTMADKEVTFLLIDTEGDTLKVYYDGLRPDAFREGAQVVVEGVYNQSKGQFNAEFLQAKCPSKYEVDLKSEKLEEQEY